MAQRLKKIVQVTKHQTREFKIVYVSDPDLEVLTNIFLLELSGEMSLDKGSFTSASISYQDKLQEIIQLTLLSNWIVSLPEKRLFSRHGSL